MKCAGIHLGSTQGCKGISSTPELHELCMVEQTISRPHPWEFLSVLAFYSKEEEIYQKENSIENLW